VPDDLAVNQWNPPLTQATG